VPEALQVEVVKAMPAGRAGLPLFAMVRDEDYILPHFFEHYRRLGVEQFVIYDDRSGPDACELLMAQPDTAVIRSQHLFNDMIEDRRLGQTRLAHLVIKTRLPEIFFPEQWVLMVDPDEFLILPTGVSGLGEFVDLLEAANQPYASAPMVDFYGDTLNSRNFTPGLAPFQGSPYFDVGPYYYWVGQIAPAYFGAGVRTRLLKRLCESHPEAVRQIYGDNLPSTARVWKTPLLKHGRGVLRLDDHIINAAPRPTDLGVALAHFKFTPDLDDKIDVALSERQHSGGSVEYAFLKGAIDLFGSQSLLAAETRWFEGPRSLEEAGLLRPVS
jgi:hypothetical protein